MVYVNFWFQHKLGFGNDEVRNVYFFLNVAQDDQQTVNISYTVEDVDTIKHSRTFLNGQNTVKVDCLK